MPKTALVAAAPPLASRGAKARCCWRSPEVDALVTPEGAASAPKQLSLSHLGPSASSTPSRMTDLSAVGDYVGVGSRCAQHVRAGWSSAGASEARGRGSRPGRPRRLGPMRLTAGPGPGRGSPNRARGGDGGGPRRGWPTSRRVSAASSPVHGTPSRPFVHCWHGCSNRGEGRQPPPVAATQRVLYDNLA